jgi:cytochrome c-type biogenesis protein
VIDAPLAFAFSAGLIAAVNPCGFAMLPAYLSYFLGVEQRTDDGHGDGRASLARALLIGATVSLGFLLVFGTVGLAVTLGLNGLRDVLPWVTIAIGIALMALGIAMLAGFRLQVALPRVQRGADGAGLRSLFLFGVSYATASLSCALPVFLVAVADSVDGFTSGLAAFAAYALGMSLVLVSLTVSLALARRSLVATLRGVMRHVDKVAGVLLIVAGAYTVWYWVTDLTADPGDEPEALRVVQSVAGDAQQWIRDVGPTRVGVVLGVAIAGIVAWVVAPGVHRRLSSLRSGRQSSAEPAPAASPAVGPAPGGPTAASPQSRSPRPRSPQPTDV